MLGVRTSRRVLSFAAAVAALLLVAACTNAGGGSASGSTAGGPTPDASGSIYMEAVQVAYMGSGTTGKGTLEYQGATYDLRVGGLGVGGIGLSRIIADGEVYDLRQLSDIEGVYGQVRTGWALGRSGRGQMWLQNTKGVVLHLHAKREGLMLSLGVDGLVIRLTS